MSVPRPAAKTFFHDFWRGLTTPDLKALKIALVILLGLLGLVSELAHNFRHRVEDGEVSWSSVTHDSCRASILAMRGAQLETDPSFKTLVFAGPSALRCWLPHPDDADRLASSATGAPVRVLSMCSNRQSYAFTAALLDRFGADFDGWFVLGVSRQTIGRAAAEEETDYHRRESRILGFDSKVLRLESAWLGCPQEPPIGWEAWDRRAFYHQCQLGFWLPESHHPAYDPYMPRTFIPMDAVRAGIAPLSGEDLQRHLGVLARAAARIRGRGHARLALVETPWVDTFTPAMQTPEWMKDEAAYQQTMAAWSREHDVPWLTMPAGFEASAADFADPRHIATPTLRIQFLESVTRDLLAR